MNVTVLVPVTPDRRYVWDEYCARRWRLNHPDWNIVEVPGTQPWNKGRTLNPAIRDHDGILVVADCDLVIGCDTIRNAVALAETVPWVMPFRWLYRLGPDLTETVLWQHPAELAEPGWLRKRDGLEQRSTEGRPGGGIIVARAEALQAVGGFDVRFDGWGREDISLGVALDTLTGPHVQLDAHLWHLWHPRAQQRHSESLENLRLAGRYEEARNDPAAMAALIGEQQ